MHFRDNHAHTLVRSIFWDDHAVAADIRAEPFTNGIGSKSLIEALNVSSYLQRRCHSSSEADYFYACQCLA